MRARSPFLGLAALLLALPFLGCEKVPEDASRPRMEMRESPATGLRYLLYLPPGYMLDQSKRWPMILYLHGAGGAGENLEQVKRGGIPAHLAEGHAEPFIVLAPQCPSSSTASIPGSVRDIVLAFFSAPAMIEKLGRLVEEVRAAFRVDPARVCLTGFSMGANGAWDLAIARPELFSRLAPVGGQGLTDPRSAGRLRGLAVWILHGAEDMTFSAINAREALEDLKEAGVDATLTVWEGASHVGSSDRSYSLEAFYDWAALPRPSAQSVPPQP